MSSNFPAVALGTFINGINPEVFTTLQSRIDASCLRVYLSHVPKEGEVILKNSQEVNLFTIASRKPSWNVRRLLKAEDVCRRVMIKEVDMSKRPLLIALLLVAGAFVSYSSAEACHRGRGARSHTYTEGHGYGYCNPSTGVIYQQPYQQQQHHQHHQYQQQSGPGVQYPAPQPLPIQNQTLQTPAPQQQGPYYSSQGCVQQYPQPVSYGSYGPCQSYGGCAGSHRSHHGCGLLGRRR